MLFRQRPPEERPVTRLIDSKDRVMKTHAERPYFRISQYGIDTNVIWYQVPIIFLVALAVIGWFLLWGLGLPAWWQALSYLAGTPIIGVFVIYVLNRIEWWSRQDVYGDDAE